jgi:hypothetical protein
LDGRLDAVAHRSIDRPACLVCRAESKTAAVMLCLLAPFTTPKQNKFAALKNRIPLLSFGRKKTSQNRLPTVRRNLFSVQQRSAAQMQDGQAQLARQDQKGSSSSSKQRRAPLVIDIARLPQMARPHPAAGRPGNRKLATAACRAAHQSAQPRGN